MHTASPIEQLKLRLPTALRQAAQEYVDALCRPASAPGGSPGGDGTAGAPASPAAAAAEAAAIAAAVADAARDLLLLLAYLGHVRTVGGWAVADAHWGVLSGDVAPKVPCPSIPMYIVMCFGLASPTQRPA